MSEGKKEFIVKDRRIFAGTDGLKEQPESEKKSAEDEKERSPVEETGQDKNSSQEAEKTDTDKEAQAETQLPEINFMTFVLSLNASALVHLGLVEEPASNKKVVNLPLAKQTIDILGMLQEKTRGNLSVDEEALIKHLLYELRMIYIKEKK